MAESIGGFDGGGGIPVADDNNRADLAGGSGGVSLDGLWM